MAKSTKKAAKAMSPGQCGFCGAEVAKRSMTRHLTSCEARKKGNEKSQKRAKRLHRILHLVVEGKYRPEYWMHIETRADSEFGDLDVFLRDIWLECCGHLSAFHLPQKRLSGHKGPGSSVDLFGALQQVMREGAPRGLASFVPFDPFDDFDEEDRLMAEPIGNHVKKGDKFVYEYDFGSTTHLTLRVAGEREGTLSKHQVALLARNLPPDLRCSECGEPAVHICSYCV